MPTTPTFHAYPVNWIRFWVGIGVLALVAMYSGMWLLLSTYNSELQRFEACSELKRTDCGPSVFWAANNWMMTNERGAATSTTAVSSKITTAKPAAAAGARSFRSSLSAPRILSVSPDGMALEEGWYDAPAGTVVRVTAGISDAKSVDLYLIPKGTEPPLAKKTASCVSKGSGIYTASFTLPAGFDGDLQIKALGSGKEYATLNLRIAATP